MKQGASSDIIDKLKLTAPFPESYLSFLSFSNGGEGPLPEQPLWICLYSADEVMEVELSGIFKADFSEMRVIGDNGSRERVAFDFRGGETLPVVYFDMTNTDLETSVREIAVSFDALIDLIGRDNR